MIMILQGTTVGFLTVGKVFSNRPILVKYFTIFLFASLSEHTCLLTGLFDTRLYSTESGRELKFGVNEVVKDAL